MEAWKLQITMKTIVSSDIAKQIKDNCQKPDDKEDWKTPDLKIIDAKD